MAEVLRSSAWLKNEVKLRAEQMGLQVACLSDGSINAQVALVAEAPGESEVFKKVPLIGQSGQLLFQTLRSSGFTNRMEFYITNVVKRQVSFGSDKRHPINKHEQELWNDVLLWELDQLPNVRVVLAMGNFALSALTGNTGITDWRGSVLDVELPSGRRIKVVCTYNAAMVLREPKTEVTFRMDCAKLRKVLDGKWKLPQIETIINPTFSDALGLVTEIHEEAVKHGTPISTDIETGSNETACVGFANSFERAFTINWRDLDQHRYTLEQERDIRKRIALLYGDTRVKFIAQNGMFDMTWLWFKDKVRIHAFYHDTMLAHHTLYPALPHNLGFLTTQYTDHPYYKDEKDNWRETGSIDDYWRYNGKDCAITWEVARKEQRELEKQGLAKFFYEHVMRLQPHLARMTVGGILMDQTLKEEIREQLTEDVAHKLAEFHRAVHVATEEPDYYPNPRSVRDNSELYFRKLGLVGRGTSTDAANRQRMFDHPRTGDAEKAVITAHNAYIEEAKFLSTYVEMEIDPDGRARCEYKQTGVQSAPGRLSSSAVMWGSGMNLQNQPDRAHPMFIADDGYGFAYFDMAQAEARLVACFANIEKWIEQFERARIDGSYDAHRALAADMFGVPYDEVPTYDRDEVTHKPTLRFVSKRCRHGLNYRMQADRLAQTTGLPPAEAIKAYNAYHRTTPELKRWWAREEAEVRKTKTLFNAYGRRWIIMERITEDSLKSIIAFKPQSTLGDHVSQTMYLCEDDDEWPHDARMVLNVHDALIALAPLDKLKTCLKIMKKHAERPIIIGQHRLIIPADLKMSEPDDGGVHRWSTLKKVKL